MKQIIIKKYGAPNVLDVVENENPNPSPNQILIRNQFSGVNFSEIMARMGLYPGAPKPPTTLGSEACGIIESVGNNVTNYKPGDKVMFLTRYNSYSTHICIDQEQAISLPEKFTFEQGAAFPLVYITAYMMMFDLGNFRKDETILIHGAGGSVGIAAIQLAKSMGGSVIATASKWKHAKLLELGIDKCIDYNSEDFSEKVMELTNNRGVDLIIDPIGGKNWEISYRCLNKMGKLIIYGNQNFVKGKSFNIYTTIKELISMPKYKPMNLMSDNRSIMGYHLGRLEGSEDKIKRAILSLSKLIETGHLVPIIDKIFPFYESNKAHEYIQNRKNFGKVLIDFR